MSITKSETVFPCLVGFSVCFTFQAAINSILFNAISWLQAGDNQTFENMYTQLPTAPFYMVISLLITIASYILLGLVTAKLSISKPYTDSIIAGGIYLIFSVILQFSSPLGVVKLEYFTIISWILIIPFSIFGAYLKMEKNIG